MDNVTILWLMLLAALSCFVGAYMAFKFEQKEKDLEKIQTGLKVWDEIKAKMIEKIQIVDDDIQMVDASKREVPIDKREVPIDKREVPIDKREVTDDESKVPNV